MSFLSTKMGRSVVLAAAIGAALGISGSARGADYYLDASYAGPNGAAFNGYTAAYNNIASALAGMPAGASAASPNRLLIAPGTYNVIAPGSYVPGSAVTGISDSRANIDLIGLGSSPDSVVITSTLDSGYITSGTTTIGTTNCATLQLKGNNQAARNITFANSTDTAYIVGTGHVAVDPNGNYTGGNSQTASQPAVALLLQGDGQAFSNCKFLGYQDTLYTKGGRAYFTNCTVSGDNDFIFANGTDIFRNSTINIDGDHSGGAITAASTDKRTSNGIVFINSTVTGNSVKGNAVIDSKNAANVNGPVANSMYLGRPWGWQQTGGDASAVFINTAMTGAIKAVGWLAWNANETNAANGKNGGNPGEDSRFAEYNSVDLFNNSVDVSSRVSWSHQLTASQAAQFTDANIFSYEAGYPWYGLGYPAGDASMPGTGSANPSDPNYSNPAFWGDRNINNDTANDLILNNPAAYSDPSWTLAGTYNPNIQLATLAVPEPGSLSLLGGGAMLLLGRRRRH
jgi:pectinesterase